jgi:hypothetical protein
VILVEHGAGQRYEADSRSAGHRSYAGGNRRDRTILHLVPGAASVRACQAAQPEVPAVAIGTPPYLDPFLRERAPRPDRDRPLVAVSFHADYRLIPEMRWAWPHFASAVVSLAHDERFDLLGHAHPRAWGPLEKWWQRIGVEAERDWCEVLRRQPDVYVIDNSSSAFEAMALDIPVVWMTPPWYRTEINHGLRFWQAMDAGIEITEPNDLGAGIERALADPAEIACARRALVASVYAATDGRSSARAVAAIMEL